MKQTIVKSVVLFTLLVLSLTGCSCCKKGDTNPPTPQTPSRPTPPEPNMQAWVDANLKVVYFDFDKSNIRKDMVAVVDANAAALKSKAEVKLVVEGNCDERGTVEYNMALGERRANSVRKALIEKGVDANRLAIVTYGKARPVVANAKNEADHQKNRRASFSAVK